MTQPTTHADIADRIETLAVEHYGVSARTWRRFKADLVGTPRELVRRTEARYGYDIRSCDGSAPLVDRLEMFVAAYTLIATTSSAYDANHIRGNEGAAIVDVEVRWDMMFDWIDRQCTKAAA